MRALSFVNRQLSESFTSDWFQVAVKPPTKTFLQVFSNNISGTKTGSLKIYGSIDCEIMSLIAEIDLNAMIDKNDAIAINVEAPYQYFKFVYEKGDVDALARLSLICSAQL